MTTINQGWKVRVTNESNSPVVISGTVNALNGLEIPGHDYISLSYSGSTLTGVVYKDGGVSGVTVGTIALTYSGSNLISVVKS